MRRSLRLSVIEGVLHAVMVGLSESYFGALEVELGHGATHLALLSTVPLLLGALSQPLAPYLAARLGSERRLVVFCAATQALAQLGFLTIALRESRALGPLLAVKILFFSAGLLAAPAWSAWMTALTEGTERAKFFARRAAVTQLALLGASSAAGLYLGQAHELGARLEAFALLQMLALLARSGSAFLLAQKLDGLPRPTRAIELCEALRRFGPALRNSSWAAPRTLALLLFGAHVASPFFLPFLLKELQLEYPELALLQATSLLSKALVLSQCHRLAARFGLRRLFSVGAFGVALSPLSWMFSESAPAWLASQLGSGAAWALAEFAAFQLLLDDSPEQHRGEFLSMAGALSGLAQLTGALFGSLLLTRLAFDAHQVFAVSALLRALPALVLIGPPRPSMLRVHSRSRAVTD